MLDNKCRPATTIQCVSNAHRNSELSIPERENDVPDFSVASENESQPQFPTVKNATSGEIQFLHDTPYQFLSDRPTSQGRHPLMAYRAVYFTLWIKSMEMRPNGFQFNQTTE